MGAVCSPLHKCEVIILANVPGMKKADLHALPQIKDRITFLYLEHCRLNRQDGAVTITDIRGTVHVPAASLSVLLLGPGTNISHRAIELIGNSGTSIVWVGEHGVRYYAHGRPAAHSARLLIQQASLVSNVRTRIEVARKMYQMRFPNENVENMTMQQLRGKEGSRVRAIYRKFSNETGVAWNGREYDPNDYESGDTINKALSAAHAYLYGVAHAAIAALGCSPGLGFIHTGHECSFVYDIADLYKADFSIPVAFEVAADNPPDVGSATRRKMREKFSDGHILERAVRDIRSLLLGNEADEQEPEVNVLYLWDNLKGFVANAVSYGKELDEDQEYALTEGYGELVVK